MMLRSLLTLLFLASASLNPLGARDVPRVESATRATGSVATSAWTVPAEWTESDLLESAPIPFKKTGSAYPVNEAVAAFLMDLATGLPLYEKNIHTEMPMASLTKIMTALVILDSHKLNEVVTVKDNFESLTGVRIWLKRGERITVGDLLIGLLVPSGGDAALTLATFHSGSVSAFVDAMNARAHMLNMRHTHFTNPIGLDETRHYSSAYDLALLAKNALRNDDFRRIIQLRSATISSVDGRISHSFENTNKLLGGYLDIRGVKTGTTDAAGESVINLAHGSDGQEVLAVILNSPHRFQENKAMIDWSLHNFSW